MSDDFSPFPQTARRAAFPRQPGGVDRRDFLRTAMWGSLGIAAGLPWVTRAWADTTPPPVAGARPFQQPESTRRMVARLAQITRAADPMKNPYRNAEQVELLRAAEAKATDIGELLRIRIPLAHELLNSGKPEEALKVHDEIQQMMDERNVPPKDRHESEWLGFKAVCYLRMGELENCCARHNADSCLMPIQGGGIHKLERGSRGAITVLSELLHKYPGDLRARWLLNIAYMTLGEYPDKVPPAWLISPNCFASDFDIKRFPDIAASLGLAVDDLAGGVVLEDFDNDGFLDLMVSAWGVNSQLRLFHNNGDGTFTERTEEAGLIGLTGGLNMVHADYNNDGLMDVLVLRGGWLGTEGHYPCSLLRNNGDFTFTDVTEEAGLLVHSRPTQTAAWFDYNGDGHLDLFIANESKDNHANPCELFRNNGDGTFTECAAAHGLDLVGFFKGVVSADYNNDGRPDLFLSRLDGSKILLRNDGPAGTDALPQALWRFTDVSESAGVTEPPISFTCWFWDYDNDGLADIVVSGYAIQDIGDVAADYLHLPHSGQRMKLYRNNGDGTFTDATRECGLDKLLVTMGANFGDLDNDGWLDFYAGTGSPGIDVLIPNRMFRNDGGRRFQDVTTAGGFGQLQKGHAVAFGDINNNGTQDIYAVIGGAVESDHYPNQLFANPGHGNHWLKLKLEGGQTNRGAWGARVQVVVRTDEGERSIHRTVGSGGSFGSSPSRLEIGLGRPRSIERVEIFWPVPGKTQVITGLEIDRFYHIRQDSPAVAMQLRSFPWPVALA